LATAGTVVGSLRRHEDEPAAMLESLGALWVAGCSVAWDRLFPVRRVPVALPAYPWQRERYWIERVGAVGERSARRAGAPDDHPLLGRRLDLAHDTERAVWETELDGDTLGEPLEHRVGGVRMLAAAAVVAMMATAGRAAAGGPRSLTSVELRQPIALPEAGSRRRVQTVVAGLAAGARVTVYSRGDETGWTLHAEARLSEAGSGRPSWTEPARGTATARAARESGENAYEALRRLEVEIADRLRVIRSVQPDATMIGATIDGNGAFATTDDATRLAQVLDAAFQLPTLGSVLGGSRTVSMPMRLAECRLHDAAGPAVAAHATKSETAPEGGVWNLQLLDGGGSLVAELVGLRMKDMAAAGGGELHEIQWIATAPVAQGLASARGRWIVLGDSAGVASVLSKHLAAVGGRMIAIGTGAGWEGELREQIEESDCRGVIVLSGLDSIAGAAIRESLDLCRTALGVVRAMLATHQVDPPRLWLVTRGAQAVPPDGASRPLAQSLWGFGRVIAEEHPEMWGGLIDLDPTATREADGRNLVAALADSRESEVAFRGGRLLAPRLRRVAPTPVEGPRLRPDASYVITGGLGALGLHVARWMAAHGAQDLVLLSRTPLPPREAWSALTGSSAARVSAVAEIEALGVRVHHGAVDVADMDALRGFLDRHRAAGLPTVRGVVHTAAVIDDRRLDTIDAESLDRVWHPKAQGAWHLHQIFEHEPLDFFVLFSSLGSVLGQTGQGSYAAANAFLDGLAHLRAAKGLPTVSVNWAGWAELGFAGTPGGRQVLEDLRVHGIAPLDPARALDLLAQALSGSRPQVVAVSIAREKTSEGGLRQSRLLAELRGDEPASARDRDAALARELVSLSAEDRSVRLERLLCESLGRVLKVAPDRVDRRKPLGSIGVDSLIALEFRRRLEAALGLALPATMVWNYPTVVELAGYLASRLAGARQVSPPPIAPAAPTANPSSVERVDELTDEEAARALLAARRPSHGG
jgi:myxalamid-type polyketide synthase MxaE and MxaD